MKRIFLSVVTGLLISYSFSVQADGTRVGVVDLQKIMQTSTEMKEVQLKLEKEFKPRRDKLVAAEESIKSDMEKFKRDSAVMSQSQKKDLEQKIVKAQQDFERNGQQYQQELGAAHNKAMEGFYNKVKEIIAKVAEKEKYDLVLQKDAAPFSANKVDVTAQVMKSIN